MNNYQPDDHLGGTPRESDPSPKGSLLTGLLLATVPPAAVFSLGLLDIDFIDPYFALAVIFSIGVVQILWIIPFVLLYRRQPRAKKGLLIGAGLVLLLNVTCLIFMSSFNEMH